VGNLRDPDNLHKISPYRAAVDAGLLSVMTFYGRVNGTNPVRYKDLLDILKNPVSQGGFGFEGFIITDWSNMGTGDDNIANSVNAGIDMNMAATTNEWQSFITTLTKLVGEGRVTMERINDAVYRILLFKKVFGILDNPIVPESNPFPNGSPENRQVARDIAAQTLVLLKNTGDIVGKLGTKSNILVTGDASAHLGYQCGGWTRVWQGMTTATIPDFTGVNIEEGIRAAVGAGKTVYRSANGNRGGTTGVPEGFTPDVVIAVVCETSYSEGTGDAATPSIGTSTNSKGLVADATMLANIRTNYPNVPIVLIVISGRPLSLSVTTGTAPNQVTTNYGEVCDGVIAAWLPGSEAGDAIADVLFGTTEFVGKTPMTWYVSPNRGGANPPAVVFPYGWGLRKGEDRSPNS
jgi:beta-glucosidase